MIKRVVFVLALAIIVFGALSKSATNSSGPDPANDISFIFPTSNDENCQHVSNPNYDCYPWTQEQANYLANSIPAAKQVIMEKFGPRAFNATYVVRHTPRMTLPYRGLTIGSAILLRDPAMPDYTTLDIILPVFWHEWGHTHYGSYGINDYEWQESLSAQTFSHFIQDGVGYSGPPPTQSLIRSDYEQYNKPFFDSKAMSDTDAFTMYKTSPMVWIKLEQEHPGLIKQFYFALYDRKKNGLPYSSNKEGISMLQSIIEGSANPFVEGEQFLDWFAKQYSIFQTTGNYKFGSRIVQEDNGPSAKAILFVSFVRSYNNRIHDSFTNDAGYTEQAMSFELFDGNGNLFFSKICGAENPECIIMDGRVKIDISDDIKANWPGGPLSSLPTGKVCARVKLENVQENYRTPMVSCYYFRGSETDLQKFGINGTVGEESDSANGSVKITPLGSQTSQAETVEVVSGAFAARGLGDKFYAEAGPYRIEYFDQNHNKKASKIITKDKSSYYYTHISLEKEPPQLKSLSSTAISSESSTFNIETKNHAGIAYYVQQGTDVLLSGKSWEQAFTHSVQAISLATGNKYNLFVESGNGVGAKFSSSWQDFGASIGAYIAKWVSSDENKEIIYNMRVTNLSQDNITNVIIEDPVNSPSAYVNGSAMLNGNAVTDNDDGDGYTLIAGKPTWNIASISANTTDNNTAYLSFKVSY